MKITDKVRINASLKRMNDGFVGLEGVVTALQPNKKLDVTVAIDMTGHSVMGGVREFCFKTSELDEVTR